MSALQTVYERSPGAVQDLMVSVKGAINSTRRYGKRYWQHREFLRDYDTWSADRMIADQNHRLQRFVRFTAQRSPFYEVHWAGSNWRGVTEAAQLDMLPILEKEVLRENVEQLFTVSARRSEEAHTGGTTGKSLVVRVTVDDSMERMAMLDHFKARHGFENRRMRRATFSGKHLIRPGYTGERFWRYNAPVRQMLYSTFDLSEENLHHYVHGLNEFKPQSLDGFFMSICDLASYVERHDIKLTFRPTAIFPTSETVTPRGRALIERVFGAKVYDQYASSEGAPFVTECAAGGLHVEESTGVFEQLDGTSEVLVTSFTTHGTPLVRYRIGDEMDLTQGRDCPCGRQSPLVDAIRGRSSDYLLRPDGARINGGHVANLFKNMPNALVQAQCTQRDLHHIDIVIVVDRSRYRDEYDDLLRSEFLHAFGPESAVTITKTEEIPREASGKLKLIKNHVSAPRS